VIKLIGECNKCGLCCYSPEGFKCLNLEVVKVPGQPEATRCRVYDKRYDGMPIVMQQRGTAAITGGVCRKDSFDETMAIFETGIGKGCSLQVAIAPFADEESEEKPTTN